ncbi:hypothetical protein KKC88_02825 [Patescibacteria group bacterium]|nr:hypothetical protein [Patescibacteria group bacterium]MBU1672905.1 hypothetical protein [Patescibacteria group bacterium]MBU1963156.1 hypothetical protein [Patescibacteria group bacterium]
MEIEELIKKHNIIIENHALELYEEGLRRMKNSEDPLHADEHVGDIFGNLDEFLRKEKSIRNSEINFSVLLPAIAWHDTWKATRPQTKNLVKYRYEQIWDGIGSARVLTEFVQDKKIDKQLTDRIVRSVYYHTQVPDQLRRKSEDYYENDLDLETKILRDMDGLDMWSMKRIHLAEAEHCDEEGVFRDRKMFFIARWVYNAMDKKTMIFHFDWPKQEYLKRKKILLDYSRDILDAN